MCYLKMTPKVTDFTQVASRAAEKLAPLNRFTGTVGDEKSCFLLIRGVVFVQCPAILLSVRAGSVPRACSNHSPTVSCRAGHWRSENLFNFQCLPHKETLDFSPSSFLQKSTPLFWVSKVNSSFGGISFGFPVGKSLCSVSQSL